MESVDTEEDDATEESDSDSDINSELLVGSKAGETVADNLVSMTRSGRTIIPPDRLIRTITLFQVVDLADTTAEICYFGVL